MHSAHAITQKSLLLAKASHQREENPTNAVVILKDNTRNLFRFDETNRRGIVVIVAVAFITKWFYAWTEHNVIDSLRPVFHAREPSNVCHLAISTVSA